MKVFNEGQLLQNIINIKFNEETENINLLCCIEEKFVVPMLNLMYSVRHFSSKKIKLFVLTSGLSNKSEKLIKEKLEYLDIDLWMKKVDLSKYEKYLNGWSVEVYMKLFAFDVLPKDVDKVLYLDADTLAVKDIANVYSFDVEDSLIAVSLDGGMASTEVFEIRRNLNIKHDYFNSGTILMNLKKQREVWTVEAMDYLIKNSKFKYPTQDYLNIICEEKDIKFLPYGYNFQSWWEIKDARDLEVLNVNLIHFINPHKPWVDRDFGYYTTSLFYECAAMTHIPDLCPAEYFKDRLERHIKESKQIKDGRTINLLSCINDKFVKPLINMMFSIRQFNNERIDYYVLSTKLTDESIQELKDAAEKVNMGMSVTICELPDLYMTGDVWSLDVYLRALSFEFLPKHLDKILFLDGDMQAFNDIAEIYDQDLGDHLLAARKEPWRFTDQNIINSCKDNEITHDYFNAGVLLLNLNRIRKEWTKEMIFDWSKKLKLYFLEQDILNKICSDEDILYINDRYNYFGLWVIPDYKDVINKNPIMMHFIGPTKPWNDKGTQYIYKHFFESAEIAGIQEYINKGKEKGILK